MILYLAAVSRDLEKSPAYFEINEEAVVFPLFHVKKCAI